MRFIEANTLYAIGDVLRCESAPWRSQGEALLCADWEPSSNSREVFATSAGRGRSRLVLVECGDARL